jgi:hypothetical protein
LKESHLLKHAHVLIFSNNLTAIDINIDIDIDIDNNNNNNNNNDNILNCSRLLFQQCNPSVTFQFVSPQDLQRMRKNGSTILNKKQHGANMAVQLGFSQGWFAACDWVTRINPDVLIRTSDFILTQTQDDAVDGVFALCGPRINTDFFAMRPRAIKNHSAAFSEMSTRGRDKNGIGKWNHELTALRNFQHILDQKRARFLPDLDPMQNKCRVRGERAPVYHDHDSCLNKSMLCNALEDWKIT